MNARALQEPALRWGSTATFVGCAVGFCVSFGEWAASSSVGLFLGMLIAAGPTFTLWGRELDDISLARDRERVAENTTRWSATTDDDDEDDEGPTTHTGRGDEPTGWNHDPHRS